MANSNTAVLTVVAGTYVDVLTFHNDISRTAQNLNEARLSPGNVTQTHFKKLGMYPTDGKMDAQPLVASNLSVGGTTRNVLYVATEHDTVFAFDADTGVQLWSVSTLPAGSGELPADTQGCNFVSPEIGITSTPVIDRTRGAIYVVAASKSTATATYYHRLHALNLETGAEMFGGPTTVPSTFAGITPTFNPTQYLERSALLEANGKIYTSWSSHCDGPPYTSWVIVFDATTLQISQAFNGELGDPDGKAAYWNGGAGPSADSQGYVYLLSGNGTFDTTLDANGFPLYQDYGNSFIKLAPPAQASSVLSVSDYFAMFNANTESAADHDLGSGGGMLLPDLTDSTGTVRHLMIGGGKDDHLYLVNRDNMGKFNAQNNSQIFQYMDRPFPSAQYGIFGSPAYFNQRVYFGAIGDAISAFDISATTAMVTLPASARTTNTFAYPGAAISISANGNANGIVWALENSSTQGVLHAYDASNIALELYNSSQAGTRDTFGPGSKFNPPTIANGKVYVTTQIDLTNNPSDLVEGVAVFGAF